MQEGAEYIEQALGGIYYEYRKIMSPFSLNCSGNFSGFDVSGCGVLGLRAEVGGNKVNGNDMGGSLN